LSAPGPRRQLNSWKEIAASLGVSIRTAQKWEAEFGLPVKRSPGDKGRVSADPAELESWQAATVGRRRPWNDVAYLRPYALLMTLLALGLLGFEAARRVGEHRPAPPALAHLEQNFLMVEDAHGRELWRKAFPSVLAAEAYAERTSRGDRWSWFGNLDRDPGVETVFVYHPSIHDPAGDSLICFSERGKEKWRFSVGRSIADRSGPYSRNYRISSFLVAKVRPDDAPQILVSSHHVSGHPNQFVVLGHDGRLLGEYWHSGRLPELNVADLDGDGRPEILLAGTDAGYRQATLVALDSERVFGAAVEPPGDLHQLQGLPPAQEKARTLFPSVRGNHAPGESNRVTRMTSRDGIVEVVVHARNDCADCEVVYTFGGNLRLRSVRISEALRSIQVEMLRKGSRQPLSEVQIPPPVTLAGPAQ
jgi:hypothetical protein